MDIEQVVTKCREAGETWADFSAAYHRFDKGFKTKFAEIKQLVRTTQTAPAGKLKWTSDDLEDATHCHPDWKQFLEDMDKAYANMIKSKVAYDSWRNALDSARSIMATEREERRNIRTTPFD